MRYRADLDVNEFGHWSATVRFAGEATGDAPDATVLASATARGATPGRALDFALKRLKDVVGRVREDLRDHGGVAVAYPLDGET